MPDFTHPYSGMTPDRMMTLAELSRAIRLALTAEHEAIHLYQALAEATDQPLAKAVLRDIANEERIHAGEFQRLLSILLPDEELWHAAGAAEVDEIADSVERGVEDALGSALDDEEARFEEMLTIGSLG